MIIRQLTVLLGCLVIVGMTAKHALGVRGERVPIGEVESADGGPTVSSSGRAVVYVSDLGGGSPQQIFWQPLDSGLPRRLVYQPSQSGWPALKYLPSPDGCWLYVRDGSQHLIVGLPSGEQKVIANVEGAYPVPYWSDNDHLLLETNTESGVFTVSTGSLSGPMPMWSGQGWLSRDAEKAWFAEYSHRRYPNAVDCLLAALVDGREQLAVERHFEDYPEPPETLFVRTLGIRRFYGFRGMEVLHPSVACSPDCSLVARSGLFLTSPWKRQGAEGEWTTVQGAEARVDVFRTGRFNPVWSTSIVWPGYEQPEGGSVPRYSDHHPSRFHPHFAELRWSADARFLSFTASQLPRPWGIPLTIKYLYERDETTDYRCDDRKGRPPVSAVIVVNGYHRWPAEPCERSLVDWTYLYIPDAMNAFVVPASR